VKFAWRPRRSERPEAALEPVPRRRLRFPESRETADHVVGSPHEWNLWELERRARVHTGPDVPQEWAAMFRSLREFAYSDGRLPTKFDALVRESFPELTQVAT
jgi:hypothetical protein